MVQDNHSQKNGNGKPHAAHGDTRHAVDPKWQGLVLELCTPNNSPRNLDEIAAARYLSGQCSERERDDLEETIGGSQSLDENVALAREVLKDMESAA